jgi:4-diphosphocytidyl-2-C-methyl-D-erythritol kinase
VLAGTLGADVPFFLADGPQLGRGDGAELAPLDLPQDYWVVLALPHGAVKVSTADVYRGFDERVGADGWEERRARLERTLAAVRRPRDLAALPANDLASSPLAAELLRRGAFRADVSGAGPAVYGLFHHRRPADAARRALRGVARTWLTVPAWYG